MARKKNGILLFFQLVIFCILYPSLAFSQPIPFDKKYSDSLLPLLPGMGGDSTKVKHLVELSRMYFGVSGEKAIAFAIEGETLAKKIGYKNGVINCLRQQAFYYGVTGDWPKASLAINEFEKLTGSEEIFVCNMRWLVSVTKNDTLNALKWALKALRHPQFHSLPEIDTWATYMQLTRAYTSISQLDSAVYYSAYLKKLISKYGDIIPDLKFVSFEALGELAIKRKEYAEALVNFRLCQSDLGLAQTYQELRKSDSAIYYALKTVNNNNNFQAPGYGIEAARILVDEYSRKNPVAALKYQQILIDKKDKLYSVQKVKQMEAVSLVAQLQEFDLQAKAVADRNRLFKSILFTVLFFLSLFIFVLWRNNNSKRITNLKLVQSLKDLESAQTQLIQAEKMASLGELTAGIAHEIQNPLNFVNNFSDVNQELIMELKDEIARGNMLEVEKIADSLRENEGKINHHGKRADAIVKNMLQHSRSGNGQVEPTDINALCDEYLRLSYHGLRAKDKNFNATLETDYELTVGKLKVIPQDIGRVLLNLFNNAFYAVAEKKKMGESDFLPMVSVSTQRVDGKVQIIVGDNGSGISEKLQGKIFQPFFTTKPTGQGTGLGLSLSYDIIKSHGGEILVKSSTGEGTVFTINLPDGIAI